MSKKHFIAFANWIAARTDPRSRQEATAVLMVCEIARQFNAAFDEDRFVAWIDKQRKQAA